MHLAEETHRPEITVPRAMMTSFIVGTIGAFAISVVLVYGITDVVAILTTKTGSPFVEIVSPPCRQVYYKTYVSLSFGRRQAQMQLPLH